MDQIKIGTFLKELRKEKNLTQEQFAEQIGVSGRTVSRWETGSNMPDISLLGVCALVILMLLEFIVAEGNSAVVEMIHIYCETLVYVTVVMICLLSTGLLYKLKKKQREIKLPKPLLAVIAAVIAFASAGVIKYLLTWIL